MGTGQTKILSHRWAIKKHAPLWLFYTLRNPKQFCFQGLAGKKKKKNSLPHDFFSCCEIQNKDIFKAGIHEYNIDIPCAVNLPIIFISQTTKV